MLPGENDAGCDDGRVPYPPPACGRGKEEKADECENVEGSCEDEGATSSKLCGKGVEGVGAVEDLGGHARWAVTAIQAPIGAIPSANPSQRWEAAVIRLVYEYPRSTARVGGASARQRGFKLAAATMKTAAETAVTIHAKRRLRRPAGSARPAVRGFMLSILWSASRLKAMAANQAWPR